MRLDPSAGPVVMQVPRRFSVGWLMGLVAVVALVFGLAIELRTHHEFDLAALQETMNRQRAAWHREQIALCDRSIARGVPYGVKQRNFIRRRSAKEAGFIDAESFNDWTGERRYHDYRAGVFETEAAAWAEKRQAIQARLLLPF